MARVMEDGDGRVVVGHPLVQCGGGAQPAVAGYPLPEEPPPQPSRRRGRPYHYRRPSSTFASFRIFAMSNYRNFDWILIKTPF
ncbi:hypothetical protein E2562_021254 [Oryza meyeriana var. granulata]|uniref:Uncharacterized protein n=1 Tax=Oryza meyeriana var. granulata TaxID=110450 RepID=A0A6G1DZ19_9ORYZ|nr:hypothetical protein E2562_021254 [Oryza meyeriana var. granulata]